MTAERTLNTDTGTTRRLMNPLDIPILWTARRFGSRAKEVERFLKFAVVGAIGAILDFGMLALMQRTLLVPHEPYLEAKVIAATTIAFITAVLSNFLFNRYWTYPDSRTYSVRRQLSQFTFINFVGWVFRTIWIRFTFAWFGVLMLPTYLALVTRIWPDYTVTAATPAQVGTIVAQFIALWVVMVWNFLANRYWTYNDVK